MWGGNQNTMPEEGIHKKCEGRDLWEATKKDALVAGTKINCTRGDGTSYAGTGSAELQGHLWPLPPLWGLRGRFLPSQGIPRSGFWKLSPQHLLTCAPILEGHSMNTSVRIHLVTQKINTESSETWQGEYSLSLSSITLALPLGDFAKFDKWQKNLEEFLCWQKEVYDWTWACHHSSMCWNSRR